MRRMLLMLALVALAALAIGTANVLADDGQGDHHDGDQAAQCTTQPTTWRAGIAARATDTA